MHEDARGGHATGPLWVPSRAMPRQLSQGDLGTIADALAGDLVVVASLDGRRYVLGLIGFLWHEGAHVHLSGPGSWAVNHGGSRFVYLPPARQVRFLGLRPWTPWHETDAKRRGH
jgi:hypothetical protein